MRRNYRLRKVLGDVACYLALGLIMIFMLGPLIWILLTSVQPMENLMSVPPRVSVANATLKYYNDLFADSGFVNALRNTIVITIMTTAFSILVAVPGAYAVARFPLRRKNMFMFAILGLQLGPAIVFLIPLFVMVRNMGLIDTRTGVVLVLSAFVIPMAVWLLRGFFENIPKGLELAARMDGCSRLGAFIRIIIPLARGGIIAIVVSLFISIWGEFLVPLILTFSRASTLTIYASAFGGLHNVNYGGAAAVAVLCGLPSSILAVALRRHLVSGLLQGSIKG
jgi:multiple sugar transport system permease protein